MAPKCATPQVSSCALPWNSAALASAAPATVLRRPLPSSVAPPGRSPSIARTARSATRKNGVGCEPNAMP